MNADRLSKKDKAIALKTTLVTVVEVLLLLCRLRYKKAVSLKGNCAAKIVTLTSQPSGPVIAAETKTIHKKRVLQFVIAEPSLQIISTVLFSFNLSSFT